MIRTPTDAEMQALLRDIDGAAAAMVAAVTAYQKVQRQAVKIGIPAALVPALPFDADQLLQAAGALQSKRRGATH